MNEIEFLPERIRRQRASRHRLVRSGYLLGACVLAMAALTLVRHQRIAAAQADLQAVTERAEIVSQQVALIGALEQQMTNLLIKKRIDDELGSRADCIAALAELCRVTPESMALRSLALATVEVRPSKASNVAARNRSARAVVAADRPGKSPAVRRLQLTIVGVAPSDVDVANFIGRLSASCLFEDVNMDYARTVDFRERQAREFQARCYLIK